MKTDKENKKGINRFIYIPFRNPKRRVFDVCLISVFALSTFITVHHFWSDYANDKRMAQIYAAYEQASELDPDKYQSLEEFEAMIEEKRAAHPDIDPFTGKRK